MVVTQSATSEDSSKLDASLKKIYASRSGCGVCAVAGAFTLLHHLWKPSLLESWELRKSCSIGTQLLRGQCCSGFMEIKKYELDLLQQRVCEQR